MSFFSRYFKISCSCEAHISNTLCQWNIKHIPSSYIHYFNTVFSIISLFFSVLRHYLTPLSMCSHFYSIPLFLFTFQWAEVRSSVEIDNYRENYLALASKRKRLQLRLRGASAKIVFSPISKDSTVLGKECQQIIVVTQLPTSVTLQGDREDKEKYNSLSLTAPNQRVSSILRPPSSTPLPLSLSHPRAGNFVDVKSATWGGVGGTRTNLGSSGSLELLKGTSASLFFPSIVEEGSEGGRERGGEGGRDIYEDIDDNSPYSNALNALNSEELVYRPDSTNTANDLSTPPRQPPSTSTLLKTPPRLKAVQGAINDNSPSLSPRLPPTSQLSSSQPMAKSPFQSASKLSKPPSYLDTVDPNSSMMDNPLKNIKHPPDSVQSPNSPRGQNQISPKSVETAASRRLVAAVAARQKAEENSKNASQMIRPSSLAVFNQPKNTEEKSV